jgi:2-polyprenyl-3-methyl-5-hydroxy-6-metoxy-1,4-benzoquinol methylase
LDDFIVSHLPNKYVGVLGVQGTDFYLQREALLQIARGERETTQLLAAETNLPNFKWSKYYYEPARTDVVNLVPAGARSVLSVGCGWGALEESLIRRQIRVVGIPLDSVIATCAEARGVETLEPDFQSASKQLEGEQFDCVLISNVLHLLRDPTAILARCAEFLSLKGCIVLVEPNFVYLKFLLEAFSDWRKGEDARGQSSTFVRPTTHRLLRRWLKDAGFTVDQVVNALPRRMRRLSAAEWRFLAPILARDVIVRARRASVAPEHRKASRSSRRGPDHEGVARPVRVEVSQ